MSHREPVNQDMCRKGPLKPIKPSPNEANLFKFLRIFRRVKLDSYSTNETQKTLNLEIVRFMVRDINKSFHV